MGKKYFDIVSNVQIVRTMPPNGPAIKGVSVAERVKAGAVSPNRGRVPVPARAERLKIALWAILAKEPVCGVERSMARFLRQVASLLSFTSVAVQV